MSPSVFSICVLFRACGRLCTGLTLLVGTLVAMAPSAVALEDTDIAVTHTMTLSDIPGDIGGVVVAAPTTDVVSVDVLMVIDEHLQVLPLEQGERGRFAGEFPTPARAVEYRFSIGYADGRRALSRGYTANSSCATLAEKGERITEHEVRLLQAQKLSDEVQLLGILGDWLEQLPPSNAVAERGWR